MLKVSKKPERLPWMRPDVQRMNDRCTKAPLFKDVDKWLRETWAVFHGTRTAG